MLLRIVAIGICIIAFFSCTKQKFDKHFEAELKAELGKHEGTFAVAFKDLQTGDEMLVNAKESFHAASTMKTPVMIEVFKQAETGKFSLDDSVVIKNEFSSIVDGSLFTLEASQDSEQKLYGRLGEKELLSNLMYHMIISSSNLATNIIMEMVDAKNVTASMRAMGANDIQVLRGVEDSKAYQKGLNNTTTAYDQMLMFEKIAKHDAVDSVASEKMIDILLDQRFNEIIPANLPKEVKVAHKTGSITGVLHDAGIVMLPDGQKYVLVLLSKGLGDEASARTSMAKVSEMIYKRFVN